MTIICRVTEAVCGSEGDRRRLGNAQGGRQALVHSARSWGARDLERAMCGWDKLHGQNDHLEHVVRRLSRGWRTGLLPGRFWWASGVREGRQTTGADRSGLLGQRMCSQRLPRSLYARDRIPSLDQTKHIWRMLLQSVTSLELAATRRRDPSLHFFTSLWTLVCCYCRQVENKSIIK